MEKHHQPYYMHGLPPPRPPPPYGKLAPAGSSAPYYKDSRSRIEVEEDPPIAHPYIPTPSYHDQAPASYYSSGTAMEDQQGQSTTKNNTKGMGMGSFLAGNSYNYPGGGGVGGYNHQFQPPYSPYPPPTAQPYGGGYPNSTPYNSSHLNSPPLAYPYPAPPSASFPYDVPPVLPSLSYYSPGYPAACCPPTCCPPNCCPPARPPYYPGGLHYY